MVGKEYQPSSIQILRVDKKPYVKMLGKNDETRCYLKVGV